VQGDDEDEDVVEDDDEDIVEDDDEEDDEDDEDDENDGDDGEAEEEAKAQVSATQLLKIRLNLEARKQKITKAQAYAIEVILKGEKRKCKVHEYPKGPDTRKFPKDKDSS
jgi:hypothetical protein